MKQANRLSQFARDLELLTQRYGVELVPKPFGRAARLYVADLETQDVKPLDLLQYEEE